MDVFNPDYYRNAPINFECIDLSEQYSFNAGNAIKYMFRLNGKDTVHKNIGKAIWYTKRAIAHGERFMPILPTENMNAAQMLDMLEMIDWAGCTELWDVLAACARGEEDAPAVLNILEKLQKQFDKQKEVTVA